MPTSSTAHQDVTRLLVSAAGGDPTAPEQLLPLVYAELRRLARNQFARESSGHTLQPTALVHEAYLRLVADPNAQWRSRGHFYGAAALAMRRILVERARRRARLKHGGGRQRVDWDVEAVGDTQTPEDLISLDEALKLLEARDPRKAEIVHLRYFAGLSIEQTAAALGLSLTTVKTEWTYARAWLRREVRKLQGDGDPEDS